MESGRAHARLTALELQTFHALTEITSNMGTLGPCITAASLFYILQIYRCISHMKVPCSTCARGHKINCKGG